MIARVLEKRDEWGDVALVRAKSVIDLVAADAQYHKQCYGRYLSGRITKEKARGRPEDAEKQSAVDRLCTFFYENDKFQYSLAEPEDRMSEEGKPVYSWTHLKEKKKTTGNISGSYDKHGQ